MRRKMQNAQKYAKYRLKNAGWTDILMQNKNAACKCRIENAVLHNLTKNGRENMTVFYT